MSRFTFSISITPSRRSAAKARPVSVAPVKPLVPVVAKAGTGLLFPWKEILQHTTALTAAHVLFQLIHDSFPIIYQT